MSSSKVVSSVQEKKLLALVTICALCYLSQALIDGLVPVQILELTYSEEGQIKDLSYTPTLYGYKFTYTLFDGTQHEEVADVVDPSSPDAQKYIQSSLERSRRPKPELGKRRGLASQTLKSTVG